MRTGQSLALRAIAALVLMVVFFSCALLVAAALTWLGVMTFSLLDDVRGRVALLVIVFACACIAAAGVIVWSVLPRFDRFEPPGPELREEDSPVLFAEIRRIAAATEQAPPVHVYVVGDVNAFVTERGGVMGLGSQRVMGIGLPLLEILSVGELRAVLAHEFGHFHGGDTKLGPWIYKTRAAVGRTVVNLARSEGAAQEYSQIFAIVMKVVRAPFGWFATMFMRITQAISRAQEYGADALAARVVGSAPLAEGLKKTHAGGLAYSTYFDTEVAPLLEAGYRPPISAGYRCFVGAEIMATAMTRALEDELRAGEQDEFDSHPPLRERVAAVEALAMPSLLDDDRPALELAHDVPAIEARIAAHMMIEGHTLTAIEWEESAARVLVPSWRKRLENERETLAGVELGELPRAPTELRRLAEKSAGGTLEDVSDEDITGWATGLFGTLLTTALLDRGWTARNIPGAPIELHRDGTTCQPFKDVQAYLAGATETDAWHARIAELFAAPSRP